MPLGLHILIKALIGNTRTSGLIDRQQGIRSSRSFAEILQTAFFISGA